MKNLKKSIYIFFKTKTKNLISSEYKKATDVFPQKNIIDGLIEDSYYYCFLLKFILILKSFESF